MLPLTTSCVHLNVADGSIPLFEGLSIPIVGSVAGTIHGGEVGSRSRADTVPAVCQVSAGP